MKKTAIIIISLLFLGTTFSVNAQEMTQKEKNNYSIGVLLGKKITEEIQKSGVDMSVFESIKEQIKEFVDLQSIKEGISDILKGECKLAKEEVEATLAELEKKKEYLESLMKPKKESDEKESDKKENESQSAMNYQQAIAQRFTSISFYYLFIHEYTLSEQYALKALELDNTYSVPKTNLAHALLFQNRFSEAEIIYKELMQAIYKDNETFTKLLLEDFDQLEKEGAIPEKQKADVEKIRKMLRE